MKIKKSTVEELVKRIIMRRGFVIPLDILLLVTVGPWMLLHIFSNRCP